jgi:hypothetical protein
VLLFSPAGGTGTLGRLIAEWLAAQNGAPQLHLISRTGRLSDEAAAGLLGPDSAAFNSLVTITAADTAAAEDMHMTVHGTAAGAGYKHQPVSSFMHAGGVLADATLANQTLAGIRKVAGPKTASMLAWMQAGNGQPVSHQVLFSSVASLLGAPGQANYAAANAGLDGLAAQLAACGLPAVSVQWGAWADGGMAAADAQTAARVERMGMSLISPAAGLAALEGVLTAAAPRHVPVLAATPFLWDR